ncbi:hypothetical protein CURE108131_02920 [Cupriavidus respiraculi]|uniref:HTH lysR-type domain-containing protein n=1 Tax=Cupriavidus respiraculi TaxID=195930 RepID=A0ABM8WGW2_9BURK|nr:hypothetical protein LMG21510_00456 [Cupriavidus respiraculi]
MRHVSTKLLGVFVLLMEYRDLHAVAMCTQCRVPTVSYALAKLREITGDPLFVKRHGILEPTPHAMRMEPAVRRMLEQWANLTGRSGARTDADAIPDLSTNACRRGCDTMVDGTYASLGESLPGRERYRIGEIR